MPHKPAAQAMNRALKRLTVALKWFVVNQPKAEQHGVPGYINRAQQDLEDAEMEMKGSFDEGPVEGGVSHEWCLELDRRITALEKRLDRAA